ncbi:MAG TPA: hypothetical protein ENG28_00495 [Deltaproteobacteria bacterium]|nr:hypothetical protein [Deltaproteobacteria bacterium]
MTEQTEKQIGLQDILEGMIRRKFLVLIPLVFFIMLGAWLYFVLPRYYEATTLIIVQPQEIPSSYVESTVSIPIEERVRTLSQEVMSRSHLEKIILEMNLYSNARRKGTPMDILVENMRKHIKVEIGGARGARNQVSSFSITFRGRDPQKVADVTNKIASLFIDSNLRLRAREATETTHFLENQLANLKKLLEIQEQKIKDYKNKYMGELPEQLQTNLSMITSLQTRLESLQSSLSDAMDRKLLIQQQLGQEGGVAPAATFTQRQQRISELRARLENMKTRYTPEHPEIKMLEEQIKKLESTPEKKEEAMLSPHVVELKNQLAAATIEIKSLQKDINNIKSKIKYYQKRVENTPKREQELAGLTRDYDITQRNYQSLLDRVFEAKMAENLERRQQGEQFRVVDLALPPQSPVSPDMRRLAFISIILGILSGTGMVLLLEYMDTTVRSVTQLEQWTRGLPCITAIPFAPTAFDLRRRKLRSILYIGIIIAIVALGTWGIVYSSMHHIVIDVPISRFL